MLSYLTSTVHSSSSSDDEQHRTMYSQSDESHLNMFNTSAPPMSYYPNTFGSFVYGSSAPFGFPTYDEMSTMNGANKTNVLIGEQFSLSDPSRVSYPLVHMTKRTDPNIEVKLENAVLWKQFAEFNLEMIITKNGR